MQSRLAWQVLADKEPTHKARLQAEDGPVVYVLGAEVYLGADVDTTARIVGGSQPSRPSHPILDA